MERNLCVSETVDDDLIHRAWTRLFGNNSIQRIEHRNSKKIIHLDPYYLQQLEQDEDEMAEILDMYQELETGTLTFWLHPTGWMYGSAENNTVQFEVCFE
jgi:hypothetical protein